MSASDVAPHSSLFSDLRQLGRILILRHPEPGSFSPNIGKFPWIALLYCLASIAFSIALNGMEDGALVDGIAFIGMVSVPFWAVTIIAGLLKWIDRRQNAGSILLAFTLLLLMLPPIGFIFAHAQNALPSLGSWATGMLSQFISVMPYAWLTLAATLFVARIGHNSGWRRGLCMLLTLLTLPTVFTSADPLALWRTGMAVSATDTAGGSTSLAIDEEVLYGQPRILNEYLGRIEAGRPGVPEIFFLGVAGDEESVFMREIITAEQLFKDRYGTAGHSMILINNPATANRLPFANHESLSRVLQRIGEQMNGEEDLLFLFLTSHGTSDHRFSIRLSPFEFSDITPQMLAKALDGAGIKRRVVVISACYSGGFIPELENDHTLVITAASADRASFGCDDTSELTDFGHAYFGEALLETRSFTEAFERAKIIIATRETASGSPHSNPQIAGGKSLRAQLEWFAREPKQAR